MDDNEAPDAKQGYSYRREDFLMWALQSQVPGESAEDIVKRAKVFEAFVTENK